MKALVFKGKHHVDLDPEWPDPTIQAPSDALVRITTTAICGSDLHGYERDPAPGTTVPRTMGHEVVGIIEEVGPEVRNFKRGQRVVSPFSANCGTCFYCRNEWYSTCEKRTTLGGAQAQYARIPFADATLEPLPDDVSDEEAAFLSDIFPTGFFAAERGEIKPGMYVAVVGCGPLGLCAQISARLFGPARLIALDNVPYRLELAERINGATPVNPSREDARKRVLDLTEGRGADVVIEAVGSTGGALKQALDIVRPFGTVSMLGVPTIDEFPYPIRRSHTMDLTFRHGSCPAKRYIRRLMPLIRNKQVPLREIVTHVVPINQGPEMYRRFAAREHGVLKVLLKPWG